MNTLSCDPCIEAYLAFLALEIGIMSDDSTGRKRYFFAHAAYAEFRRSGDQQSRFRTWLAIRKACQWAQSTKEGK